jgi:hypothetical protein
MATVESELDELKQRIEQLESGLRHAHAARKVDFDQLPLVVATPAKSPADMTRAELHAGLLAAGMIRKPTPQEEQAAARWAALSEEEQAAVRWELDHLPPGPMASDIGAIPIATADFQRAAELTQVYPLKAYDAVQLAVALRRYRQLLAFGASLTFVAGDGTLLNAALAEGLPVANPCDYVLPQDTLSHLP